MSPTSEVLPRAELLRFTAFAESSPPRPFLKILVKQNTARPNIKAHEIVINTQPLNFIFPFARAQINLFLAGYLRITINTTVLRRRIKPG